MTREVISHFLFFIERVLGPLTLVSAHTTYPNDQLLCETAVLTRLVSLKGQQVSVLASIGGVQPDQQELTVKGTKTSRRVTDFHTDTVGNGGDFIALRMPPKDPRATSLRAQVDNLSLHIADEPNKLATRARPLAFKPLSRTSSPKGDIDPSLINIHLKTINCVRGFSFRQQLVDWGMKYSKK
jgi:hypothetical protein